MQEQDRFQRYFAMLKAIPREPLQISAPALHAALTSSGFEVTLRTVERDLEKLSTQFALTCDDSVRPQTWSWLKTAEVQDIPRLSRHAALTFKLVEQHLLATLPPTAIDFLQPYFNAAERALQPDSEDVYADWAQRVRLIGRGPLLLPPDIRPAVHDAVYNALLDKLTLDVDYLRAGASSPHRSLVHPQGLVVRNGVIYLICVFDGFDDLRQLALHRIQSARVGDHTAYRLADFDIDDYIAAGNFGISRGQLIELCCRFDRLEGHHLLETPLSADQRVEADGDAHFILHATVPWTAELVRWLLGWGPSAKVLGPEALRNEIRQKIRQMYEEPD